MAYFKTHTKPSFKSSGEESDAHTVSIRCNPFTTGQVYPPKSTHRRTVVNLAVIALTNFFNSLCYKYADQ